MAIDIKNELTEPTEPLIGGYVEVEITCDEPGCPSRMTIDRDEDLDLIPTRFLREWFKPFGWVFDGDKAFCQRHVGSIVGAGGSNPMIPFEGGKS